ncbi:MAG: hypothetical protein ACJ8FY_07615 [Gemmataceae bacterium]
MGLFSLFRRLTPSASRRATVTFDDESVTCRRSNGKSETVRWSDLRAVLIQTTDAGPFVDDVFWVLAGERSGCVVPSEADGMDRLLERLQRLPNFDNRAVIDAMASTDNREFVCWKRERVA